MGKKRAAKKFRLADLDTPEMRDSEAERKLDPNRIEHYNRNGMERYIAMCLSADPCFEDYAEQLNIPSSMKYNTKVAVRIEGDKFHFGIFRQNPPRKSPVFKGSFEFTMANVLAMFAVQAKEDTKQKAWRDSFLNR